MKPRILIALMASAFAAIPASGAQLTIADVTASSTFYTYNVNNLINGVGLIGSGQHSGDYQGKWMTNNTVTGSLVFDLGAVDTLTSSKIWNYNGGCCDAARSVKDLTVSTSVNGVTYSAPTAFMLSHTETSPFGGQSLGVTGVGRYVKFDLLSNYGAGYTGLSEVQFFGAVGGVPEPAAWALMIVGFGLVGVASRRRSVAVAT